jgi:hypothetical protein
MFAYFTKKRVLISEEFTIIKYWGLINYSKTVDFKETFAI